MIEGAKSNYVDREFLAAVLDWLLHRRPGDPNASFSLTIIEFHNPTLLGEMYGAHRASHMLDEFGLLIVNALRSGDIVTRVLSTFCVLTPSGHMDALLERLRGIIVDGAKHGLEALDYSVRTYDFPSDLTKNMDGAELLAALENGTFQGSTTKPSQPVSV